MYKLMLSLYLDSFFFLLLFLERKHKCDKQMSEMSLMIADKTYLSEITVK